MAHVPRVYLPGRIAVGTVTIEGDPARRLANVMRVRPGDPLFIFSGDGREWSALIKSVDRTRLRAEVVEVSRTVTPLPLIVECWCGLIRPARFDWAIEKCTEAGVDLLRPLISEHSARGQGVSEQREERWERIAIEASEQSGRLSLPVIAGPARFEQLLAQPIGSILLLDRGGKPWPEVAPMIPLHGRLSVAVGPEGGFSEAEVAAARARGALVTSIGSNTLRTETAALAGVLLVRSLGR